MMSHRKDQDKKTQELMQFNNFYFRFFDQHPMGVEAITEESNREPDIGVNHNGVRVEVEIKRLFLNQKQKQAEAHRQSLETEISNYLKGIALGIDFNIDITFREPAPNMSEASLQRLAECIFYHSKYHWVNSVYFESEPDTDRTYRGRVSSMDARFVFDSEVARNIDYINLDSYQCGISVSNDAVCDIHDFWDPCIQKPITTAIKKAGNKRFSPETKKWLLVVAPFFDDRGNPAPSASIDPPQGEGNIILSIPSDSIFKNPFDRIFFYNPWFSKELHIACSDEENDSVK